jgi:hypothetical protein
MRRNLAVVLALLGLAPTGGCWSSETPGQAVQTVETDVLAGLSDVEAALDDYLQDPTKVDALITKAAQLAPKGSALASAVSGLQSAAIDLKTNQGTVLAVQQALDQAKSLASGSQK